ncbi:hypothetical protein H0N96_01910 [Candidatus Micrarchaeota archaeon]|nr:hypothetical protein [Candidatus Micrarchaeota archaeon]
MKYVNEFLKRFSDRVVFTATDARVFLTSLGASGNYTNVFLTNLVKSKRAKRLKKGVYSFRDDPTLASFAFTPSYHGLQDALSIHGLWEQETIPVIITPKRVRQGVRTMLGGKVLVRRIARKMFFGFESVKYRDCWINVSDVEKTLVDLAYFKQPVSAEVAREARKRVDERKMREYLEKTPRNVKNRVLKLLKLKPTAASRQETRSQKSISIYTS